MGHRPLTFTNNVVGFLTAVNSEQFHNAGIINNLHMLERNHKLGYYRMGKVLMDCNIIEQLDSRGKRKIYRWLHPDQNLDGPLIQQVVDGVDKYRTHRRSIMRATGKYQRDPDKTTGDWLSKADSKRLHKLNVELSTLRKGYLELSAAVKKLEQKIKVSGDRVSNPKLLMNNPYEAPPTLSFPLQKMADHSQSKKIKFPHQNKEKESPKR